ncbi:disrupted in schizophrenia 1 protein [Protopterus annectens]|uniref:disrupted in schizophrenia 1 protein n=1 Tax=Protopterus annectens TaxID=7888 RepID=UPI001CFB7D51|nr:disrupted in schizophrenia 1 protein [Protopterus annectens]
MLMAAGLVGMTDSNSCNREQTVPVSSPESLDALVPSLDRSNSVKRKLIRKPGYLRKESQQLPRCVSPSKNETQTEECIKNISSINTVTGYGPGKTIKDHFEVRKQNIVLNNRESVSGSVTQNSLQGLQNHFECLEQRETFTPPLCSAKCKTLSSSKSPKILQNSLLMAADEIELSNRPHQLCIQSLHKTDSETLCEDTDCTEDSPDDFFNSSFSFIQLSLNSMKDDVAGESCCQDLQDPGTNAALNVENGSCLQKLAESGLCEKHLNGNSNFPWPRDQNDNSCVPDTKLKKRLHDSAMICFDTDVNLLHSVDSSDTTSAGSSVTSGYESCIVGTDHSWDTVMRKYEPILQDCLLNNRTKLKVQSLILKLQRLQEKAIEEDDYGQADTFGKRLEELMEENKHLKFQLPSKHPLISTFLERYRVQVEAALCPTFSEAGHSNGELQKTLTTEQECPRFGQERLHGSIFRRESLLRDHQQLQEEIRILRERMSILEVKDKLLCKEIEEQDHLLHSKDCEFPSMVTVPHAELQDMLKVLDEIVTSPDRVPLSDELPESITSLQEKQYSLSMAIKESTAKVCTSQRLCSTIRKKISDIETQIPALIEAKMLAISGNNFSTAKELSEEMRSLVSENSRLAGLLNELQAMHSKHEKRLLKIKEEYSRLKKDLEQGEKQFEWNLKESATKYVEMLEDKLQSHRSQLLEKVWEADLETCQLLVRGFHLKDMGCFFSEGEESRMVETENGNTPSSSSECEKQCGFPNSRTWETSQCLDFKHKHAAAENISECSYGTDDNHSRFFCCPSTAVMEQCEPIRKKLVIIEEQLMTAVYSRDGGLTQNLQKEIQMVKETLQTMLVQLLPSKEEKEEVKDILHGSWGQGE